MNNPHPDPFPVALIDRIMKSTEAEIILDPFMGSGTTAIAALKNNRKYIGIELAPEYVALAEARIADFLLL
jgi:modification methylase